MALLVFLLGIEQVVHGNGSCLIEVPVQAQVLFALFYAFPGYGELFVCIVYVVAVLLYAYGQLLPIVGQLPSGYVFGYLPALNSVRTSPPL